MFCDRIIVNHEGLKTDIIVTNGQVMRLEKMQKKKHNRNSTGQQDKASLLLA